MAEVGSALEAVKREVKSVRQAARRADRALATVESMDVYGAYRLDPGEKITGEGLQAFLQMASEQQPGATLEVVVIAHVGLDERSSSNGRREGT